MTCEHKKQAWRIDERDPNKLKKYCVVCNHVVDIKSMKHFQKWREGLT